MAQQRVFNVPQLVRAVYGDYSPALIVMLRLPWRRMHASYWNYPHYSHKYGASAEGEARWVAESVEAFRRRHRLSVCFRAVPHQTTGRTRVTSMRLASLCGQVRAQLHHGRVRAQL